MRSPICRHGAVDRVEELVGQVGMRGTTPPHMLADILFVVGVAVSVSKHMVTWPAESSKLCKEFAHFFNVVAISASGRSCAVNTTLSFSRSMRGTPPTCCVRELSSVSGTLTSIGAMRTIKQRVFLFGVVAAWYAEHAISFRRIAPATCGQLAAEPTP